MEIAYVFLILGLVVVFSGVILPVRGGHDDEAEDAESGGCETDVHQRIRSGRNAAEPAVC